MKKLIYLIFVLGFQISCNSPKEYKYIEVELSKNYLGRFEQKLKDTQIINSKNDSTAILEGYRKFYISEKVNKDVSESTGLVLGLPIEFKLINEQGADIVLTTDFLNKDSLIKSIRDNIYKTVDLKETFKKNKEKEISDFKKNVKIDSVKIKELKPFFNTKKDEFDPSGKEWYEPKSAPKYTNENGIYLYFQVNDGVPSNLRLRIQYHSDDWLFFKKVQFSLDGVAYEYVPRDTQTDSGNGGRIWEWSDDSMNQSNTELLDALSNSKASKMKLVGRQYYDIKTLTKSQKRDLKRSLDLFKAMGGKY